MKFYERFGIESRNHFCYIGGVEICVWYNCDKYLYEYLSQNEEFRKLIARCVDELAAAGFVIYDTACFTSDLIEIHYRSFYSDSIIGVVEITDDGAASFVHDNGKDYTIEEYKARRGPYICVLDRINELRAITARVITAQLPQPIAEAVMAEFILI